jgi:hypothetical protein
MEPLPNNRFKLPFFVVCGVLLAWFALRSASTGHAVVETVLAVASFVSAAVVLSGRNPRWMQSPLDRWEARKQRK